MTRTIRAHFDGKVFVPDEPVDLPVDTAAEVTVCPSGDAGAQQGLALTRLRDWAADLKPAEASPGDAAAQHDHYLYGTPKREQP